MLKRERLAGFSPKDMCCASRAADVPDRRHALGGIEIPITGRNCWLKKGELGGFFATADPMLTRTQISGKL
jgi:hypothetical protein